MIRFIDEYRDQFGVEAICRTLRATECGFITSRGYRASKNRKASSRSVRGEILLEEIRRIHALNYSVYGVRKMWHAMRHAGWDVGRDQVARLMKIAGLQGVRRGRKPITTRPTAGEDQRPDLVERRFVADRPQQLWVADIPRKREVPPPMSGYSPDFATSRSSPMSSVGESSVGRLRPPSARSSCHCSHWNTRSSPPGRAGMEAD